MTEQSYHTAWMVYLLSAAGLFVVFWLLTGQLHALQLRRLLRVGLAILLFTPYYSMPPQDWLAPAILVTLFETVFGDYHVGLKAAVPLLVLLATAFTISLLFRPAPAVTTEPSNPVDANTDTPVTP